VIFTFFFFSIIAIKPFINHFTFEFLYFLISFYDLFFGLGKKGWQIIGKKTV